MFSFYRSIEQKNGKIKLTWHYSDLTWNTRPDAIKYSPSFSAFSFLTAMKLQIQLRERTDRRFTKLIRTAIQRELSPMQLGGSNHPLALVPRFPLWRYESDTTYVFGGLMRENPNPFFIQTIASTCGRIFACHHALRLWLRVHQIDICRGLNHSMPLTKMLPNSFVTRGTYLQTG